MTEARPRALRDLVVYFLRLGTTRGGVLGLGLVGLAFVIPSFVMVVAIAIVPLHFGGLWWMQGAFSGIGAAVIAIIARSALKLTRDGSWGRLR